MGTTFYFWNAPPCVERAYIEGAFQQLDTVAKIAGNMDELEFRRMLERFPVVRKKTYARVEWNSMVRIASTLSPYLSTRDGLCIHIDISVSSLSSSCNISTMKMQASRRSLRSMKKTNVRAITSLCLFAFTYACVSVRWMLVLYLTAILVSTESTIHSTDSLRDAMGKFLDSYFSAQEIMKIQREFEKVRCTRTPIYMHSSAYPLCLSESVFAL